MSLKKFYISLCVFIFKRFRIQMLLENLYFLASHLICPRSIQSISSDVCGRFVCHPFCVPFYWRGMKTYSGRNFSLNYPNNYSHFLWQKTVLFNNQPPNLPQTHNLTSWDFYTIIRGHVTSSIPRSLGLSYHQKPPGVVVR